MKVPPHALSELEAFKAIEKYGEDAAKGLSAIKDPVLKAQLALKTNDAADAFLFVAGKDQPDSGQFVRMMKVELAKFPKDLEMEDRERVADYFEQLMEIVGLDSSGGLLDNYVFGF